MKETAMQKYETKQRGRGLKRVGLYVPDNPDAIAKAEAYGRRLRKAAGLQLPRD